MPSAMICVPTMLRISVVLPQPDGPEQTGDGAAGDLHREVVDRDPLTADDPQMLERRWPVHTPLRSNSSLDEVIM